MAYQNPAAGLPPVDYVDVDPTRDVMPSAYAPNTILGAVLNFILSIQTEIAKKPELGMRFAQWRAEATEQFPVDALQQYVRAYNIIYELLMLIPANFGKKGILARENKTIYDILPKGMRLPKQVELFIAICERDRMNGKLLMEIAAVPGSSGLVAASLPPNYPLNFLLAKSAVGAVDRFSSSLITTHLFALTDGDVMDDSLRNGLLNAEPLRGIMKSTCCEAVRPYPCESYRYQFTNPTRNHTRPLVAHLVMNPLLRDRALHHWMCRLKNTSAPGSVAVLPQAKTNWATSCSQIDIPAFKKMQDYVMGSLVPAIQQISGPAASLLGSFKPLAINDPRFPLPLFIDEDGNLLGFFWHGTKEKVNQAIAETGFLNGCSTIALYGKGTYSTISLCKALQYAGPDTEIATLFLCAVFLGKMPYFVERGTHPAAIPEWATAKIAAPSVANNGHQNHYEIVALDEASILPILLVELNTIAPKGETFEWL